MSSNPRLHRRSIRLQGYDYNTSGAYFITICTYQRECFLGEIMDDIAQPSEYGVVVLETWGNLPQHYPDIELDAFVVMPNHIHGIIFLMDTVGAGLKPAPTKPSESERTTSFEPAPTKTTTDSETTLDESSISTKTTDGETMLDKSTPTKRQALSEIVRGFKTFSARHINALRDTSGSPVWQRNYYEHIIRSEESLNTIRQYILSNPARWAMDKDNPSQWKSS